MLTSVRVEDIGSAREVSQSRSWTAVARRVDCTVRWLEAAVSVRVLESPPGDTLPQHSQPSSGTFLQHRYNCIIKMILTNLRQRP